MGKAAHVFVGGGCGSQENETRGLGTAGTDGGDHRLPRKQGMRVEEGLCLGRFVCLFVFKEIAFGLKTLGDGAQFCVNLPGGAEICAVLVVIATGRRIRRVLGIRYGSSTPRGSQASPFVLLFPLSLSQISKTLW